ncbi:MAG TPA: hypothetical protein VMU93_03255 [Caulobacteraceae bacterium]|nr:hypothetical protein [Caulobacteraceae bacterium]
MSLAGVANARPTTRPHRTPLASGVAATSRRLEATELAHALYSRPSRWARAPGDVQLPTALDQSFASHRVVGSAGYLCGLGGRSESAGPASSLGREDTFLGGKLTYAFP